MQKFFLVVNLVSKKTIDTMVNQLRRGRMISKDSVIRESAFTCPSMVAGTDVRQCDAKQKTPMKSWRPRLFCP